MGISMEAMKHVVLVVFALFLISEALPIGPGHEESVVFVDEPVAMQEISSFAKTLKKAQTGLHSGIVSQTLSDGMHEELTEQKLLQKLEKDNEKLAHSGSEPDLGEAVAQHKSHDVYVPSSSEREEEQRLDKMKEDAKAQAKKMEKDFDKQHEIKKQMKELRKQSKKALEAAHE